MREIKFRAWDVFNAEMFPKKVNDDLLVKFFREVNERRNGGNTVHVMQFTGLTDSKGVDAYGSDLIDGWVAGEAVHGKEIVFDDGAFSVDVYGDGSYFPCLYEFDEFEIIGNIYQHSHLIGE